MLVQLNKKFCLEIEKENDDTLFYYSSKKINI